MPMKVDSYSFKSKLLPLLRQLEQAQADDAVAESKIKKAGCTGGLMMLAGVGSCIGGLIGMDEADLPGIVMLVPVALIVAAIVFLVKAARLSKFDLDNRKLGCAVGLLRMLRADTPMQSDVELELDLRPYAKGGKLLDKQKEPGLGGVTTTRHEHSWLSLSGALADGTRYKLSATETVNQKVKPKRKQNKVKQRTSAAVQLALRPKPGKYGAPEAIVAALQQTPPKPPLRLKSLRAAGPRLVATFVTGHHIKVTARRSSGESGEENILQVDALLSALLWAYDGLGRTAQAG